MNNTHITAHSMDWLNELRSMLPYMGHRNWILIVDKAFPLQSADGMRYLLTGEDILATLTKTFSEIRKNATHVKPIIYNDLELDYMSDSLSESIESLREKIKQVTKGFELHTLLHEEVFSKLDEASKLFQVLVLKTETLHPYTSIFIELDCGYWSSEKEIILRKKMD